MQDRIKKHKRDYLWNLAKHSPVLPFLFLQSKYIRKTMPVVEAAQHDLRGETTGHERSVKASFIGESTMAGVGADSHKDGLAGLVSQRLSDFYKTNIQWQVEGRIGYSKKQVVEEVLPEINCSEDALILVAMGGNDSFYFTAPQQWYFYTQRLIDYLRSQTEGIICFASLPPTEQFPSFNRAMRSVVGRQTSILREALMEIVDHNDDRVTFVDKPVNFHEYKDRWPEDIELADLFCDGYHPSTITYALWAEDIVEHITRHYAEL